MPDETFEFYLADSNRNRIKLKSRVLVKKRQCDVSHCHEFKTENS